MRRVYENTTSDRARNNKKDVEDFLAAGGKIDYKEPWESANPESVSKKNGGNPKKPSSRWHHPTHKNAKDF